MNYRSGPVLFFIRWVIWYAEYCDAIARRNEIQRGHDSSNTEDSKNIQRRDWISADSHLAEIFNDPCFGLEGLTFIFCRAAISSPPPLTQVIGQIEEDTTKFATKFEQDLQNKWTPENNISEADISKKLTQMDWSNESETSIFLVKIFNYLQKTHEAKINSQENTIRNTMLRTFSQSIFNYNKLLENLLDIHGKHSISNTELPKMTETVANTARLLSTDLKIMMNNIAKQRRSLKKMMLANIKHNNFLKKYIKESKQNADTNVKLLKSFINEFKTLQTKAWSKESIDAFYRKSLSELKANMYTESFGCRFAKGFYTVFTLGKTQPNPCKSSMRKHENEKFEETVDLMKKERTELSAQTLIHKMLSKLKTRLYDSFSMVKILKLVDPEIHNITNESSMNFGKTSLVTEEVDKIVSIMQEMTTDGRLIFELVESGGGYLRSSEKLFLLLNQFAEKAHSIFRAKHNPFRNSIGKDEWFELQNSILNILKN